jgi:hypothetical protein
MTRPLLILNLFIAAALVGCGTTSCVRTNKLSEPSGGKSQVETETCGGSGISQQCGAADGAWQLLAVNKVRLFPRSGKSQAMVGGKVQGSNESATNGFVTLATVTAPPNENEWTGLNLDNTTAYRWVKYTGPGDSTGSMAEVEFYRDKIKLAGEAFGTTGTSEHLFGAAFDGDTATYYEGTGTLSNYVGLDLAGGRVAAKPTFVPAAGQYPDAQKVTIRSETQRATIQYTIDGSDPVNGLGYSAPIEVTKTTTIRALATADGLASSESALATYVIGGSGNAKAIASLHVGNSLTDTIDGYLAPVAAAGGFSLNYSRYSVPGIGTWVYDENPTGGFGVSNVREYNRGTWLDHLTFQPAANMPCVPTGYAKESEAKNRSDAVNIAAAWTDQVTSQNPRVQIWVYETWLADEYEGNCFIGSWNRDPTIWNPQYSTNWEKSMDTYLKYAEKVRAGLAEMYSDRPVPYIIPGGQALVALKAAVAAGAIPGWGQDSFWTRVFNGGKSSDDHLTNEGQYFITLIFYACMFRSDPRSLPDTNLGTSASVTAQQAAALQEVAWQSVSSYQWSGFGS